MDRVSVFIDPEAKKTTLQYDAVGRNTTILFQSGLRFLNGFDAAGQQTLSRADYGGDPSLKSNFFYSYDGVGNRTGYTDTVFDSVQTMTYDAKNRLTRWQGNVISAKDYAYTYDEIDNRLTDTETGVVRTWTYDASSRLTTMTNGSVTTTFTFDTNGCNSGVNEGGALTTMSYDKENRMVSYADGSGTTASVYNGFSQKVKQGATTLVWDGFDYLGEVNGGTFDCETFTVDGQILAEKRNGTERLDFERTALGSVCTKYDQTNQARAGVQRYKPYGSQEFHDSTLPTWQRVGSWGYRPTGLSWSDYYVRARHYGTQQAQWTTVDPLWPEEMGYVYCEDNPLVRVDPQGTISFPALEIMPNWSGKNYGCKQTPCCGYNTDFWDKECKKTGNKFTCCAAKVSKFICLSVYTFYDECLRAPWTTVICNPIRHIRSIWIGDPLSLLLPDNCDNARGFDCQNSCMRNAYQKRNQSGYSHHYNDSIIACKKFGQKSRQCCEASFSEEQKVYDFCAHKCFPDFLVLPWKVRVKFGIDVLSCCK